MVAELTPKTVATRSNRPATLAKQKRTVSAKLTTWQLVWIRALVVVVFLAVWWFVVTFGIVPPAFLPLPQDVLATLIEMLGQGLLVHVWVTLATALTGFILGGAVGTLIGLVVGTMPRVYEVTAPFFSMLNAMPRIALAPLFVLWFGIGTTSHVVLVFSIVVLIFLMNTAAGALSVDRDFITIGKLLGASKWDSLIKISLPSTVPWIMSAARIAWAYSLAGAVVGEMFLGQQGLGYLITAGSGVFNVALIFAALFITVMIAWAFDNLLRFADRKLLAWRPDAATK